jgi:hypothetical protein
MVPIGYAVRAMAAIVGAPTFDNHPVLDVMRSSSGQYAAADPLRTSSGGPSVARAAAEEAKR